MSTQRLRRHQAAEIQESGNPRRSSVRGRRACSARCRTAARQGRPAAGDSTRTPIVAAPCATCLLYLMTTHSGPEAQRPETEGASERSEASDANGEATPPRGRRERAQRSEPRERPAYAKAPARSRRSASREGGSEPAKRLARERVGESEGRSPSD